MDKVERIYNKKIIKCGDRLEIYKYSSYQREGTKGNNSTGRTGKEEVEKHEKEINRKKVLYRARNNIIRLISCNNDLITFITLTYKDNMQDLKKSKEHLKLFFKKLQKDYKDLKYIYVLEFQKRGAIHYHLLCNIDFNITTAKSREYKPIEQKELEQNLSKLYWCNRGFIDVRNLYHNGITNVAKYVASYLVEDLMELDLKGNKCYGYSRNLNKPIIEKIDNKDNIEELIQIEGYSLTYTNSYNTTYTDKTGLNRTGNVNYFDYIKNNL